MPSEAAPTWRIRPATEADVPSIFEIITDLAIYEKAPQEVKATEEKLRNTLFGPRPYAEVILAVEEDGRAIGMALFVSRSRLRSSVRPRSSSPSTVFHMLWDN